MTSQKGGGDVSPVKPQIHKERDSGRGLKFAWPCRVRINLQLKSKLQQLELVQRNETDK